jgi:hypothetical protein
MKEIKLTKGQVALVDDDDFEHLNHFKWKVYFSESANSYYATRKINGKHIAMHRILMNTVGTNLVIDHKDHNGLNNQKQNLRIATKSQNGANRQIRKNATSKFLGVHWDKSRNKWRAAIKSSNQKQKTIGRFENETEAALAYNDYALKLHGEFANLNTIN